MKILFFGDIVGKIGREAVKQILPSLKKEYTPDVIIANAENLAHGKGITRSTIDEMRDSGITVFTTGNHISNKPEYKELLEDEAYHTIRPANYPPGVPGRGFITLEISNTKFTIINLMGRVFFREDLDDPFRKLDEIIKNLKSSIFDKDSSDRKALNLHSIIIDWHTEATSEKYALGYFADGRVSAVLGTHTHVPTADARILAGGTAFVADVGMVGARDSMLGVETKGPLTAFLTQLPQKHEIPKSGIVQVNSIYLEIDDDTGKAKSIKRVDKEVMIYTSQKHKNTESA